MVDVPVIDIWVNLFTRPGIEAYNDSDAREAALLFNRESMYALGTEQTPTEFVADMDDAGVEQCFIPAFKVGDPDGGIDIDIDYDTVQGVVDEYPDRFKGLAGINPHTGMEGVWALEEAVEDHDFVGAHLHPHGFERPINHREFYPFYAKCAELDVPVLMQVGHSAEFMPNRMGKPLHLDDVALDFPEVDFVACHLGWPWTKEMEAIAWKHPNVYVGTTAHAPKYWEEHMVTFMRTRGQDKVLFGTDFPVLSFDEAIGQIENAHDFPEDVQRKLFRENAMKIFDL